MMNSILPRKRTAALLTVVLLLCAAWQTAFAQCGNVSTFMPTVSASVVCSGSPVSITAAGLPVKKWVYQDNHTGTWQPVTTTSTTYTDYPFMSTAGTRTYRAVVSTSTCPTDTTMGVDVQVTPPVYGNNSSIRISASGTSVCSGTIVYLNLLGVNGTVQGWVRKDNNGSYVAMGSSSESTSDNNTTVTAVTTRTYRALVKQPNNCAIDSSAPYTITINPPVYGNNNTVRPNVNAPAICGGSNVSVSIEWNSALVQGWVYRDNNTGSWSTFGFASNSVTDNSTNVTVPTTRAYRALLKYSGSCNVDTSDAVTITVNPSVRRVLGTIIPTTTTTGNVCAGSSFSVQLTGYSSSNVLSWIWRDSASGSWTVTGSGSTSLFLSASTSITKNVTREIRVIINNAALTCTIDTSAPLFVPIMAQQRGNTTAFMPVISNANTCSGAPVQVYMNTSLLNVSWLYRNNNTGSWISTGSGTQYNDNNTTVTVQTTRSYRALISSSANCSIDTTNEVSTLIKMPAYGSNRVAITPKMNANGYCVGTSPSGFITLTGPLAIAKWIYRDNNTGSWTDLPFQTSTSFSDQYTGSITTATVRSYRALIRNNETCSIDSSNEVSTMISPLVRGNINGTTPVSLASSVCVGSSLQLNVQLPGGYTVQNWLYRDTTVGTWNSFGFSSSNPTDGSVSASWNRVRTYRVLLQNTAGCRVDTSAAVAVNINVKAKGNSGVVPVTNNPAVCGGATSVTMQVSIPSNSSVQKWVYRDNNTGAWLDVTGSSSFTSYTDPQSNTGVLVPTIRAYRAIISNNNACSLDTTAAITSSLSPLAGGTSIAVTPTLSGSPSVCNGSSYSVSFSYSGQVQRWIYRDNNGPWYDNNNTSTFLSESNVRVTAPTVRTYKALVYRQGACFLDTTQSVVVNITPYSAGNTPNPVPSATVASLCAGNTASVGVSLSSGQAVAKWIYRDNNTGVWLDFTGSTSSGSLNDNNTNVSAQTMRSYRAIMNFSACRYDTTSALTLAINVPVNGNQLTVTPSSSQAIICSGSTANISVSGFSGSIKRWIYRDNGGVWFDVPGSSSSSISHTNTTVSTSTTRSYRALIASNSCSIDSSAIYNITINPVTPGNNATRPVSSVSSFCATSTSSLNLSVSPGSGYTVKKWLRSDNNGPWTDFGYTTASTSITDYSTAVLSSVVRSYRAVMTNTNTCSSDTSDAVSVSLNASMKGTLSVAPTSARSMYCYGIQVSASVVVPSGYNIQRWIYRNNNGDWKYSDNTTTSSTYTDNNTYVGATTSRSYRVIMTNATTCSTDTTAALNVVLNSRGAGVNNAATLANTSTPVVCSGGNVQLSVAPPGANTVYKWIYSNNGLAGPWYDVLSTYNNTTITHSNTLVNAITNRLYRAIITDTSTCDYDSSQYVTVVINPMTYSADTSLKPGSLDTVCIAASVSLSITPGSGNSVQKWIYQDNSTGPWLDFSTSTATSSFTDNTTNIGGLSNRSYRAIVLKGASCSNDSSKVKTVYFKAKTTGNSTLIPSVGGTGTDTICAGSSLSMSISGTVDAWLYRDGNGPWTTIAGSNSSFYTHTNLNVSTPTWRFYRAMLNTGSCNADSSATDSVFIRFLGNGNNNNIAPVISNPNICAGSQGSISIGVPSGATVQKWIYRDNNFGSWSDLSYGSSTSYIDYNTGVTSVTTRSYRVIYLRNCSYDTTAALSITITPRGGNTNTSLTPTVSSATVCAGSAVSNLSVAAGSGNTIQKWIYRDNNNGPWIDLVVGNSNNINDYNTYVGTSVSRSYRAIIVNNTTCTYDTTASLNVTISPIVVGSTSTITPTASPSAGICSGTVLTVNVAPGSGNQVVRWTYNTNGGSWTDWGYNTSNSITDYNTYVSGSTTKAYRALIYQPASCRIDTSLALNVTINPRSYGNDNTITPTSSSAIVCYGSTNTLSVIPGSNNSVNKWIYRDNNTGAWIDIAGGNNSFSDYSGVSTVTTRSYRALITKGSTCTIDTSAAVTVTLSPLNYGTDNTIAVTSTASVCTGSNVSINVTPGSGNTVTAWMYRDNYTGSWNTMAFTNATSITDYYTGVSSTVNRTYRALIRKGSTCNIDTSNVDTTVISLRVNGTDNTIIPTANNTTICVGTVVNLNVTPGSGNTVLKWIYRNDAGAWTDLAIGNNSSLSDYNTYVGATTVRTYRAIITKGTGCTYDSSAAVSVTINPRANGNDNTIVPSSASATYCAGSYVNVSVTPGSGNSISKWIYRNGTGAWLDWNVGTSATVTDYSTSVSVSTTRSYRAIIAKGSACNLDTSAVLTVTLNPVGAGNQNTVAPVAASPNVCAGGIVNLSVSGYTGTSVINWIYRDNLTGPWIPYGSASNAISDYNTSVSATTVRSYRAIVNNTAGCSTDTTGATTVTINPLVNGTNPTPAQTAQPTFCSGNAVNVFINTPAGYSIDSWLSRTNGGAWSVFTFSTSASVYDYTTTVTTATTREYRAILRNASGCSLDSSAMVSVSINPLTEGNNNTLVPVTSTPSVCSGNNAVVSLSGFSGSVIKWIYRDTVITSWSTIFNTSATLVDNNTFVGYNRTRSYRAIVYNAANCSNDTTAEVLVQLRQQLAGNAAGITPTSANNKYCSGTPVPVNVSGLINGGVVTGWLYSDNGGAWQAISGSAGFSYTHNATAVTALTTRSYRALVLTGCSTDTTAALSVTIDVYPTKPVITSSGDSLFSSVSGTAYVWKKDGTTIAANTQRILVTDNGNYTVEVSNASGCKSVSDPFNFVHTGIAVQQLAERTTVYPNPTATGQLHIALGNVHAQQATIRITDLLGKVIMQQEAALQNGSALVDLDISAAAPGIYLVTVSAGQQQVTRRVLFSKQ